MKDGADEAAVSDPLGYLGWNEDPLVSVRHPLWGDGEACLGSEQKEGRVKSLYFQTRASLWHIDLLSLRPCSSEKWSVRGR